MLTLNDGWLGDGIAFPDFDKILDFTSAGGEASASVNVNGNTDLEYKVITRNLTTQVIYTQLNNDATGSNYGLQYIQNNGGTITASRGATTPTITYTMATNTISLNTILTPAGFIKTCFYEGAQLQTGTTVGIYHSWGLSWNSTANVTSMKFLPASGNFTAGTRIIVYRRRVN